MLFRKSLYLEIMQVAAGEQIISGQDDDDLDADDDDVDADDDADDDDEGNNDCGGTQCQLQLPFRCTTISISGPSVLDNPLLLLQKLCKKNMEKNEIQKRNKNTQI